LDDFDDIRPTEQGFLVTLQHHIFEVPFLAKFRFVGKFSNLGDNLNGLV
jgi:hypothetical protein